MHIWTYRLSFKTAAVVSAAAALILFTVICTAVLRADGQGVFVENTDDLCVSWLHSRGLEADPRSLIVTEVTVPAEFDELYKSYNEFQIEQGFDLRHWAGMPATLYSYTLTNALKNKEDIRANLLTCEENVIGFDLYDLSEGEYIAKISDIIG